MITPLQKPFFTLLAFILILNSLTTSDLKPGPTASSPPLAAQPALPAQDGMPDELMSAFLEASSQPF